MKNKILSIIALLTIFVPFTVFFVWKPELPNASAIIIGYCVFIAASFLYSLFLFLRIKLKDNYTKIALGINGIYLAGILFTVVFPRL